MDWDNPEAQRLAEAALLIWSGLSYSDYTDTLKELDWSPGGNAPAEPLTREEWTVAEQYEEYVHEAVARLIAGYM
jgi:hypothetical protein